MNVPNPSHNKHNPFTIRVGARPACDMYSRCVARCALLHVIAKHVARRARSYIRSCGDRLLKAGVPRDATIDAARERLAGRIFSQWKDDDIETLARLMSRFAVELESDEPPHAP